MELGQILHNNPVFHPIPDYAHALIAYLRDELSRAFWNTQQKHWEGARDFSWLECEDSPHALTPLPSGIEWRHYYNWGGCPEDADWDQAQANAPNFSFKNVEIRWYKHFGRSMNSNVELKPLEWIDWFTECVSTIGAWETENSELLKYLRKI
jgi:hypothetical protein